MDLLYVASAPCNAVRWTAPRVVLFFPTSVQPDVERELLSMGVHVAVGPGASLPCQAVPLISCLLLLGAKGGHGTHSPGACTSQAIRLADVGGVWRACVAQGP